MPVKKLSEEARRIIAAWGYSRDGLRYALRQPAFRTELAVAVIMIPLGLILAKNDGQRAMLVSSVLFVLIVELINSAVEAAIDRISPELHPLSKAAKDMASAAVFLSLVSAAAVWLILLV